MTPLEVLYYRDPPDSLEEMLKERDAILDDLHFHLMRAKHNMELATNSKRSKVHFDIGDKVFLKLQPYSQRSLAKRPYKKLVARYYGPFEVLQQVGTQVACW